MGVGVVVVECVEPPMLSVGDASEGVRLLVGERLAEGSKGPLSVLVF